MGRMLCRSTDSFSDLCSASSSGLVRVEDLVPDGGASELILDLKLPAGVLRPMVDEDANDRALRVISDLSGSVRGLDRCGGLSLVAHEREVVFVSANVTRQRSAEQSWASGRRTTCATSWRSWKRRACHDSSCMWTTAVAAHRVKRAWEGWCGPAGVSTRPPFWRSWRARRTEFRGGWP